MEKSASIVQYSAKLRKEVKKADKVYLATDPDREGEAISWHLEKALKLEDNKKSRRITFNEICNGFFIPFMEKSASIVQYSSRRITFNEITKNAVKASLKQAREIDMNLVNAQQAASC